MIGETFSHYKISGKLGSGGMGEVVRAEDIKLRREVAIQVLPRAFAQDEDRMKRFEREAQVLASLNHPNVAAIYGLEEASGVRAIRAIVLELDPRKLRGRRAFADGAHLRPERDLGAQAARSFGKLKCRLILFSSSR